MSESDNSSTNSVSSEESSSESDSGHDFGEQSSIVRAYQDEPLAPAAQLQNDDEEEDEDGIPRASLEARYEGTVSVDEWCQQRCRKCRDTNLEGSREYRCCQEMLVCTGKYTFIGEFPKCITEHQEYKSLSCKIVLEMAGPLLTTKGGKLYRKGQNSENDFLRAVAYRWLMRWLCGPRGWDNARPLPACIYEDIRTRYASFDAKTGYRSSEQRE